MLKVYDFRCANCAHEKDFLVDDSEKDDAQDCPECGNHSMVRVPSRINFTAASFVDGSRSRDESWARVKEAAQLEVLKARLPPAKRKEVSEEINKLKSLEKKKEVF